MYVVISFNILYFIIYRKLFPKYVFTDLHCFIKFKMINHAVPAVQ